MPHLCRDVILRVVFLGLLGLLLRANIDSFGTWAIPLLSKKVTYKFSKCQFLIFTQLLGRQIIALSALEVLKEAAETSERYLNELIMCKPNFKKVDKEAHKLRLRYLKTNRDSFLPKYIYKHYIMSFLF